MKKEFPELGKDREKLKKIIYYLKNNKLQVNISNKFKKDLKKRLNNLVALKKPKRKKVWFFALPSFAICLLVFGVLCYYKDMNFFKNRGSDVNVLEFVPMSVRLGKLYDNTEQKESDEEQTVKNEEISGGNNIDKEEDLIEIISPSLKPNTNLVGCEIISIGTGLDSTSLDDDGEIDSEVEDLMDLISSLFSEIGEDIKTDFERFCNENSGSLVDSGQRRSCRVNQTECLEINYDGTCNFIPIN